MAIDAIANTPATDLTAEFLVVVVTGAAVVVLVATVVFGASVELAGALEIVLKIHISSPEQTLKLINASRCDAMH